MQGEFDFMRGQPPRPKRPERLLVALMPREEAANCIDRFRTQFISDNDLPGSLIATDRLHVSLHHIGDYKHLKTRFVYAAQQAGEAVSMPPFEATFRSVATFDGKLTPGDGPRKRPLVLLGEGNGLTALHKALGAALVRNGLRAVPEFTPHITLLYGPRAVPARPIEPIRIMFDAFVLIHSELWLTRYNVLDRWTLN